MFLPYITDHHQILGYNCDSAKHCSSAVLPLQNWMPLYMASLGSQGLAVTGRLSSMPWLAAAVVGMLAGSAADR
jgi:hypothetical protein